MDEERQEMVRRLEEYARRNPSGYRARVVALAAIGYVYLLVLMVGSLVLSVAIVWWSIASGQFSFGLIKLVLALLLLGIFIFGSLWVRVPVPQGVELTRKQAPALFDMLDSISARLTCPVPNHVLLDTEFNAAAAQIPRFGVFGGYRQYLLVGFPLLSSVSAKHLEAILGHEMGHLSARHGRLGIWVYRLQETWARLLAGDRGQKKREFLDVDTLFRWFPPYFMAYSFALRRAGEYEADRMAAEVAGVEGAVEALSAVWIRGDYFAARVGPSIRKLVADHPEPPERALLDAWSGLAGPVPERDADNAIKAALSRLTDYDDSHPAPRDRVAALTGIPAESVALTAPLVAPGETAAAKLLGPAAQDIARQLEARWIEETTESWTTQHNARLQGKVRLTELGTKAAFSKLTQEEEQERAALIGGLYDGEEALPALREYVASYPDEGTGKYLLGRALLEADRRDGLECLEEAMHLEPGCTPDACQLAYSYVLDHDGFDAAQSYRHIVEAFAERFTLSPLDRFEPHDLPAEHIDALRAIFSADRIVARAYVVRKPAAEWSGNRFYVVGVVATWSLFTGQQMSDGDLCERLGAAIDLPIELLVVVLRNERANLRAPISRVPGAEIYRRQP